MFNRKRFTESISECQNIEIDYEKLGETIATAIKKANEPKSMPEPEKKKGRLFLALGRILKGEKSEDGRYLTAPFALIVSVLFRMLAFVIILGSFYVGYHFIERMIGAIWHGWTILLNVFSIAMGCASVIALILFAFLLLGSANDVEHEKDKNYVIGVFTGLVSVAALAVAIVALYQNGR